MTLVNNQTYYGPLFAGSTFAAPSGDNYNLYDTQSSMTYIPESGGSGPSNGWYTAGSSTTSTLVSSSPVSFTAAGWTGTYTTYNDTLCLNNTLVNSNISSCANLTFANVATLSAGVDQVYKGIVGLGKFGDANTNFVLNWALQTYQKPVATFSMGFSATDSTLQLGAPASGVTYFGIG